MSHVEPHPATADLAFLSLAALEGRMSSGQLTSEALTRALLERIAAIDAPGTSIALRSVLAPAEDAVAQARDRDSGRSSGGPCGRLQGIPVLVKDNIEAMGLPGTAGSLALQHRPASDDAIVVSRLRREGAVIMGSTNLSEWANFRSPRSVSGWSAMGGLTGNPWALDRSAGGSSSGSGAAVAAGLAPVAIGTETNGSITCPAALNGVVGLKPTVGSIPMIGIVPLSGSQDIAGPMTRCVADAALLYEVMSGAKGCVDACDPAVARGVRVGVASGWLTGHAHTDAMFERVVRLLEPLVSRVSEVSAPAAGFDVFVDQESVLLGEFVDDLGTYLAGRPGPGIRTMAELVAFNAEHADTELAAFDQEYLERAATSGGRAAHAYADARRRNLEWARDVCLGPALATGVDVLVAPAYRPAWKSDLTHGDVLSGGGAVATPAAILGWPVLTVPMGLVDGLPVALSIVGRPGTEATLVSVGHALETALGLVSGGALRPSWRPPQRG